VIVKTADLAEVGVEPSHLRGRRRSIWYSTATSTPESAPRSWRAETLPFRVNAVVVLLDAGYV